MSEALLERAICLRALGNEAIEAAFQEALLAPYQTLLLGGGEEPIYLPASADDRRHRIIYRFDYAASALHEAAHWCVAGPERRQLVDYGYWYSADGRSTEQQLEFERVEVKPQALEWIFSVAAGRKFKISADNLAAGLGPSPSFKVAILGQLQQYLQHGLPARAAAFVAQLAIRSGVRNTLDIAHYRPGKL